MKKIFPYLTYAGSIPFIFCAICLSADIQQVPVLGSVEKMLIAYGLVIASFMAGAHWGQHLTIQGSWDRALPLLSNIIAVSLWLGFLVLDFKTLVALFIATFLALLIIDYRLYKTDLITRHYFQTRCLVSLIVVISLIISAVVS